MSEFYEDEMQEIEFQFLRHETNKRLDEIAPEFDASSLEKKSSILLEQFLQFMRKISSKPEPFTEDTHQVFRELGMTEDDISTLKEEINKRQ